MKYRNFVQLKGVNTIHYPVGSDMPRLIEQVKEMAQEINREINRIDNGGERPVCLLVTGSSGAIIGAMISCNLIALFKGGHTGRKVVICHVKKHGENAHSSGNSPNHFEKRITIIVDDFICSGSTVNRIVDYYGLNKVDILCVSGAFRSDGRVKFYAETLIASDEPWNYLNSYLSSTKKGS